MDSMRTDRPVISEPVRHLMAMTDETVSAKYLAPILKMSESVIVKYAKDGTWDQDNLGKYVISGGRVKFFRKDFLEKCGFVDPEPEETTVKDLLSEILRQLKNLNKMTLHTMTPFQKLAFAGKLMKEEDKESAGAATPTD